MRSSAPSVQDLTSFSSKVILSSLTKGFKDEYLAKSLLSKFANPDPLSSEQRKNAAIEKWEMVERNNSVTNTRLLFAYDEEVVWNIDRVYTVAANTIKRLIGSAVPLESLYGSFSGGASTSKPRQPGTLARKYAERPDVTQEAWDTIWPCIYKDHDLWHLHNPMVLKPRFVKSNVMFTVPKNDVIDRVACKEPDLNLWMQKAAGDFIRKRLKLTGIDLNDQTVNQRLAKLGSIDGSLATLDLSSASDSVTTQLVMRLLPHNWFFFLDSLRCKTTKMPDGSTHENEMFSSMGNGFTFELESLIFYALAKAVAYLDKNHEIVSIYGDDIIVSTKIAGALIKVLQFSGFKTNSDKSFRTGPFRESCGGHYLRGVDVTPFYIREPITSYHSLIKLLNQFRKWSRVSPESGWCEDRYYRAWTAIAAKLPDKRLFGGYNLDSDESVVCPTGPGHRLVRQFRSTTPQIHQVGLYLEWQRSRLFDHHVQVIPSTTLQTIYKIFHEKAEPSSRRSSIMVDLGRTRVLKPRFNARYVFGHSIPAFPQEYSSDT